MRAATRRPRKDSHFLGCPSSKGLSAGDWTGRRIVSPCEGCQLDAESGREMKLFYTAHCETSTLPKELEGPERSTFAGRATVIALLQLKAARWRNRSRRHERKGAASESG